LLEVLTLMALSRVISQLARARGHSGCVFIVLYLPLGIGWYFIGTGAAAALSSMLTDDGDPSPLVVVAGGLAGMFAGAVIAVVVLRSLPPNNRREPGRESDAEGDW
jgi:hypothetical protein